VVSNQNHFIIFHVPVLTTVLDHSQVVQSRRNGDSRINVAQLNTRLACTLGTNKTNPFHSCQGVQVPVQTGTPSPQLCRPGLRVVRLDLHLIIHHNSRSGKSRKPQQESNKPSHSHKQVCARDNKSVVTPRVL
jgi:hypothetical protein